MNRILSSVSKSNPSVSQYNSIIFMAALTYPGEKENSFSNDQSLLTSKEKRIEYIKHIIELIKK